MPGIVVQHDGQKVPILTDDLEIGKVGLQELGDVLGGFFIRWALIRRLVDEDCI
jgi:hypothetical protein